MDQSKINVFFITLGCPKNTVDSENMEQIVLDSGFSVTNNSTKAHVVVINTCAFILDAKTESIDVILDAVNFKEENPNVKLIVVGCLSQGYAKELREEFPTVDYFLGTMDMFQIDKILLELYSKDENAYIENSEQHSEETNNILIDSVNDSLVELNRALPTTSYAYLKLSEGCNKKCSYCIIPKLRGAQRDRKMEDIIAEAKWLCDNGKNEIILICQDSGEYGKALYKKRMLPTLLKELDQIENIKWIRLMYVYPECVSEELISVMANSKHILHYIDIPIQHISDNILKAMGRATSSKSIRGTISALREKMPDIIIRSSFITGFPGESKADLYELSDFLKEEKLNRVGVFTYSREEDTLAYDLPNQIEEAEKISRRDYLMEVQSQISYELMCQFIGKSLEVVIEDYEGEEDGKLIYSARSYMDSPDIDGVVYVYTQNKLTSGEFITCEIVDASEYDLFANA